MLIHCQTSSTLFSNLCLVIRLQFFCVSETHLLSSIPSSFISLPSYSVVRHDVTGDVAKHGVCVYIHVSLKYKSQDHVENCLAIELVDLNVLITVSQNLPIWVGNDTQKQIIFHSHFQILK